MKPITPAVNRDAVIGIATALIVHAFILLSAGPRLSAPKTPTEGQRILINLTSVSSTPNELPKLQPALINSSPKSGTEIPHQQTRTLRGDTLKQSTLSHTPSKKRKEAPLFPSSNGYESSHSPIPLSPSQAGTNGIAGGGSGNGSPQPRPSAFGQVGGLTSNHATNDEVGKSSSLILPKPKYRSNPRPDYPSEARRLKQEGVVRLRISVNESGHVEDAQIAQSSGYKLLDDAALKAIMRWEFEPARRGDRAVSCHITVPLRFRLE